MAGYKFVEEAVGHAKELPLAAPVQVVLASHGMLAHRRLDMHSR